MNDLVITCSYFTVHIPQWVILMLPFLGPPLRPWVRMAPHNDPECAPPKAIIEHPPPVRPEVSAQSFVAKLTSKNKKRQRKRKR
jgi:hypothetical protein